VKCEVVCLISGKRSYDCDVVGVEGRFKLSSKSFARADPSRSRAEAPNDEQSSYFDGKSSYGDKSEPSECTSSSDDDPVDKADIGFEHRTEQDWQKVQQFDCQCAHLHPNVEKDAKERLKADVPADPTALFLAFFPLELMEHRFGCSTPSDTIAGVSTPSIDPSLCVFLSIVLKLSSSGQ
jgi:hypothetical protein